MTVKVHTESQEIKFATASDYIVSTEGRLSVLTPRNEAIAIFDRYHWQWAEVAQ